MKKTLRKVIRQMICVVLLLAACSFCELPGNAFADTASQVYTVKYSANLPAGVNQSSLTGKMGVSKIAVGKRTALRKNAFAIKYYRFLNWNTKKDGSGKSYSDRQKVKNLTAKDKTVVLYAQWKDTYLSACKKTETNLSLTVTKNTKMMTRPCTNKVISASKTITTLSEGDIVSTTAIYKNTVGQYWYKITDQNGKSGYVIGSAVTVNGIQEQALKGSVKLSTKTPAVGEKVSITGTLKGNLVKISSVKAVLTGSDKTKQTQTVKPNAKKFNLENSDIAANLKFETLKHGPGTLKLTIKLSAKYTNGKKLLNTYQIVTKTVKFTEIGQYKVVFDANGGTDAPKSVEKTDLKDLMLPTEKPIYNGYTFQGWATSKNATEARFKAGDYLNIDNKKGENLTLYAVWEKAVEVKVSITDTTFPDPIFRKYVKEIFDDDNDGVLSQIELESVKSISVDGRNISSLKGLEYFTELQDLGCGKNNLSELDVSKNLKLLTIWCPVNQLTSLDVSNNLYLEQLYCPQNQLTQLIFGKNIFLKNVQCDSNPLTSLDFSDCKIMTELLLNQQTEHTYDTESGYQKFYLRAGGKFLLCDVSVCLTPEPVIAENQEVVESVTTADAASSTLVSASMAPGAAETQEDLPVDIASDDAVADPEPIEELETIAEAEAVPVEATAEETTSTELSDNETGSDMQILEVTEETTGAQEPTQEDAEPAVPEAEITQEIVITDEVTAEETVPVADLEGALVEEVYPDETVLAEESVNDFPMEETGNTDAIADPAELPTDEFYVEQAWDMAAEENLLTEEPAESYFFEEVPAPATVWFTANPEYSVISVYSWDGEVWPEADGSYLLQPGEYVYSAYADGYEPVESASFFVSEGDLLQLDIILIPLPVEEIGEIAA